VDFIVRGALYGMGFTRGLQKPEQVPYWYWINNDYNHSQHRLNPQNQDPVVLIHGIGPAFFPYLNLIQKIRYLPIQDRPPAMLLIELPHISMQMESHVPNAQQTVDAIQSIILRHGFNKARIVAHSYGTYVTAWVMKQRPAIVSGVILIDPVCLLTFIPKCAFSFLYKQPKTAEDHLISFFVSKELHIAHVLSRHFWWWENNLWVEDIHCPITVFLSGRDSIVPSSPIQRYLTKHRIDSYYYPDFYHASFLLNKQATSDIVLTFTNGCNKVGGFNKYMIKNKINTPHEKSDTATVVTPSNSHENLVKRIQNSNSNSDPDLLKLLETHRNEMYEAHDTE